MDTNAWIDHRTAAAGVLSKLLDAIRVKHDAAREYERVYAGAKAAEQELRAADKHVDDLRVHLAGIIDLAEKDARPL